MLPEYLCVGFPRCGTTTLYDILKQSRSVAVAKHIKEPLFYQCPKLYERGINWYENFYYPFHNNEGGKIVEINPALWNKANKVQNDFPRTTKLIFIMRNPVNVLYSRFKYLGMYGELSDMRDYIKLPHAVTFERFARNCVKEKDVWFLRGCYHRWIQSYLKYFPKENMHFIIFEEFIANPERSCSELFRFIGIDAKKENKILYNLDSNASNQIPRNLIAAKAVHMLKELDLKLGFEYELADSNIYHNYNCLRNFVNRLCLKQDADNSKIGARCRTMLENSYRKEKEGIEELIHKDLSHLWF